MKAILVSEETIHVGTPAVIEAQSTSTHYSVVFEDDGETGYLYALDYERPDNPICDAMHIYNVRAVTDSHLPSVVKLIWSLDGMKAVLLINKYPHAIFDFATRRGYCRTGFPPPSAASGWPTHPDHKWE